MPGTPLAGLWCNEALVFHHRPMDRFPPAGACCRPPAGCCL